MKTCNFLLGLLVIAVTLTGFSCVHLTGNGEVASFERDLSPFEKIRVNGGAEVHFHAAEEFKAVVKVDSNLGEYVVLNVIKNELSIGPRSGRSYSFTEFTVDLYCPALSAVSISGSGKFTGVDKIIAESFEAAVSGSGTIAGTVECNHSSIRISGSGEVSASVVCDYLSADISGAGEINLVGAGKDTAVKISGSGNFNGMDFKSDRADVVISGSGNISVWVTENLTAKVSGSGGITYRGTPKITYDVSGTGKIASEQ